MSSRYSTAEPSAIGSPEEGPLCRSAEEEARAGIFDVDLLISRLEDYKSHLERANSKLQRSKSSSSKEPNPQAISAKEAAAVAAAARFRQEVERKADFASPPPSANRRMFFDTTGDATISNQQSRAVEADNTQAEAERPQTAPFPTRSSSIARRPSSLAARRRNAQRPLVPIRAHTPQTMGTDKTHPLSATAATGIVTSGMVKKHQRSITVSDPRHSIASTVIATPHFPHDIPIISPSSTLDVSDATDIKPRSPLLIGSPMEDQIRRELETMAIVEAADLLEQSKSDAGWRTPTVVHVIELEEETGATVQIRQSRRQSLQKVRTESSSAIPFPLRTEEAQAEPSPVPLPPKAHIRAKSKTKSISLRPREIQRSNTQPAPTTAQSGLADEDFVWRLPVENGMAKFGRKFSIFRALTWRSKKRRGEVKNGDVDGHGDAMDELIEMYMSEEQLREIKEVGVVKENGKGKGRRFFR